MIRGKKYAILALSLTVLSVYAVKKQIVPTGGSKSDRPPRMSYRYDMFEKPVIEPQQGMADAKARCSAWAYNVVEAFGGFTSQCSKPSSSGYMETTITLIYQRTGDLKK